MSETVTQELLEKSSPGLERTGDAPLPQRFAWLSGGIADYLLAMGILTLALPIYNVGLGVSAVWIGWALFIPRALDAIVDPLIGNLSDNTRTRWGRRRPYIFISIIVCALAFMLVWMPPRSLGKPGLLLYFLGFTMAYFAGYAFFNITYGALGLELCPDTDARARLMSLRIIFCQAVGMVMPWLYKLCLLPVFGNEIVGVRYVGSAVALLILITGLLPAIVCREQARTQAQPKVEILASLKMIIKNKSFLFFAGSNLFFQIGLFIIGPVGLYINIYYVCKGDKAFAALLGGYYGTIFAILGIATPVLIARWANHWGKKPVVIVGILLEGLGFLATWFLYHPRHPYLQLAATPLFAMGAIIYAALTPAMLGDICDLDELDSGLRREGTFNSIASLVIKLAIASTSVLGGYLLKLAGSKDGVLQTPHTILWLRLEYVILPFLLMIGAGLLIWRYPIREAQVKEARRMINEAKGWS